MGVIIAATATEDSAASLSGAPFDLTEIVSWEDGTCLASPHSSYGKTLRLQVQPKLLHLVSTAYAESEVF
jgi:hypothetical protein